MATASITSDEAYLRRREEERLLFAAPEIQAEVRAEIQADRVRRAADAAAEEAETPLDEAKLLLAAPRDAAWAKWVCEYFQSLLYCEFALREDPALRETVQKLVNAAYEDCDFAHCYLSVADEMDYLLKKAQKPPKPAASAAGGGSAPAPAPAPKPAPPPVKPLPDPMSAATRRLVLGGHQAPEKPDMHGCAYFDGAPWDICYACEYEKDPAYYKKKVRTSELVMLVSAYFRSPVKGEMARGWGLQTLEDIVAFLDTPREHRRYTDAQIADETYQPYVSLLAGLRMLLR